MSLFVAIHPVSIHNVVVDRPNPFRHRLMSYTKAYLRRAAHSAAERETDPTPDVAQPSAVLPQSSSSKTSYAAINFPSRGSLRDHSTFSAPALDTPPSSRPNSPLSKLAFLAGAERLLQAHCTVHLFQLKIASGLELHHISTGSLDNFSPHHAIPPIPNVSLVNPRSHPIGLIMLSACSASTNFVIKRVSAVRTRPQRKPVSIEHCFLGLLSSRRTSSSFKRFILPFSQCDQGHCPRAQNSLSRLCYLLLSPGPKLPPSRVAILSSPVATTLLTP
jgi:hypothetical protein